MEDQRCLNAILYISDHGLLPERFAEEAVCTISLEMTAAKADWNERDLREWNFSSL